MDDAGHESPDWEILKLLREVRRRVRAGNPQRFLDHLTDEPKWVAALPAPEAKVARTMLEATRELARRAIDSHPMEREIQAEPPVEVELEITQPPAPVPVQQELAQLATVGAGKRGRGPRVLAVQAMGTEPRRRRKNRAS